ncbi:hypothetical protein D3C78_1613080 [compost metagenome]
MAPKTRGRASADASNPDIPVATPSFNGHDNWSMKALVDLNTTIARLEVSIGNLAEKVGDVREDQQKQLSRIESVERKILVASAIVTIAIAIGGFVANKAIDFGLKMAEQRMVVPTPQPAPTLQPAPVPARP